MNAEFGIFVEGWRKSDRGERKMVSSSAEGTVY